jgi:hypothetical protein
LTPSDAFGSIGSVVYLILVIWIVVAVVLAPLKLYAIHGELRKQTQEMRQQTALLAELTKSRAPAQ